MTLIQHSNTLVTGAVSGIDFALWDLAHKIKGQPLYAALGRGPSTTDELPGAPPTRALVG
ncbi:MAG: hypothetical protein OXJ37_12155 [Bryobacterales bacterium]|nr:hypothetical protein [Bryobacterales bacterium]